MHFRSLLIIVSLIVFQGCGIYKSKRPAGSVETAPLRAEEIGYKEISERVITPSCVRCHNAGSARGGVALDSYVLVRANLGLIKATAIDKKTMPPRNPLNDSEMKLLADWIGLGGPEVAIASGGTVPSPTPIPTPWPTPGGFVTYADIATKIMTPSCVRCHTGDRARNGVKLDTYANVVANLAKVGHTVLESNTMPPRKPLDTGLKEWLRVWINEGAPEFEPPQSSLLDLFIPPAGAADFGTQKAKTEFLALGKPSMLKVRGTTDELSGKISTGPKGVSGKLVAKMDQFTTGGMALRDKHLKEKVFESEKYPTSEITFTDIEVKPDGSAFKGKLKFHGIEKDVEGSAKVVDKSTTEKLVSYDVNFKIKLTDFGVEPPKYLGLSIQNDVDVTVKGEAKP